MRKYGTYKYLLLGGSLLILIGLSTLGPGEEKTNQYENAITQGYIEPTLTPTPMIDTVDHPEAIAVRDTFLQLGDSTEEVIRKLGLPARIAATEYEFNYYIYNNDYKKLLFVALQDNQVVGFYTDSLDFNYHGFPYGATLEEINVVLGEQFALSEVLTMHRSGCNISILMDRLETGKAVGIYVLSETVKEDGYDEDVMHQVEQLVYDLANSARVRNKLSPLSWSSSAGQAASKHSENMALKDFFSHKDPSLRSPGDRLNAEGVYYQRCGENIIAGYGSAILSSHGWYNSKGHRNNLLNEEYRYLGVGFTYDKDSIYKTYITQNFYR
ncbi:MAG: hypothetical protein K0R46_160 [Herbinix sp.]|nr:hypothetical protein [Herbinix sp.]